MDDRRFGAAIREARVRRGWRQRDLAAAAQISRQTVSRIERGVFEGMPLGTVRVVAKAVEIGVELLPRSRDGQVERLVGARHAALAEAVIRWLTRNDGWVVRPELSFAHFGERGVIDLLAWHAVARVLLVIELKTEIVDVGELLGTLDRKTRLAAHAVAGSGWRPDRVGAVLIVPDSMTNRRRLAALRDTFGAALPDGVLSVRRWLRDPAVAAPSALRARMFFSNAHQRGRRSGFASIRRVQGPRARYAERAPSSEPHSNGAERRGPARTGVVA